MPWPKTSHRAAADAEELDRLVADLAVGRARTLARSITQVEDGDGAALIAKIFERTGDARVVGITGPPGAGKSTLVETMARRLSERGQTVAILAVDPTSPFSGGALLGDRIRMQRLATDPNVYIRSMATRGALGGLARATRDAIDVLDAAGFSWILVETVGVGQDEVDVVRSVDSVVVVTVPGLGDDIQAIKAGLMEIADVFVINKADREGVERTARDLEMMLSIAEDQPEWQPPVLKTVATREEGVDEVLQAIEGHREWLLSSGRMAERRKEQLRLRVETILKERVLREADAAVGLEAALDAASTRHSDPYRVAADLFAGVVAANRAEGGGGES